MDKQLKEKVLKARDFIQNGDPLDDVLDGEEVADCIVHLAEWEEDLKDVEGAQGAMEEEAYQSIRKDMRDAVQFEVEEKIKDKMKEAESKAVDSLARYKFLMFGYWAAQWVNLNKLLEKKQPSPFKGFVKMGRMSRAAGVTSDAWAIGSPENFTDKKGW